MAEKVYEKYMVQHADGSACKGKYFVLNLTAKNQVEQDRARCAMRTYIGEVVKTDPDYAIELLNYYKEIENGQE